LDLLSRNPVKNFIISFGPREEALKVWAENTLLFFPGSRTRVVRSSSSLPIPTAPTRIPSPTVDFKQDMYSSKVGLPSV